MRKIVILFPRLDVAFKEGHVPEARGPIVPIRLHWQAMGNMLLNHHRIKGDDVRFIEKPLWQFTTEFAESLEADIIYVPHKSTDTFPVNNKEVRYYMQSVFPWQFYIDSKGFAGGASRYPFVSDLIGGNFYDLMASRAKMGESKFEQPAKKNISLPADFVFFPCQIPHDETIKYHSDVTVEQALEATCIATQELNIPLYVKGHPVNPMSMVNLMAIATKYRHTRWVEDVNIHDMILHARAVVVVNSGTGMETLLHKRPIVTFGRCEYDCVSNKATTDNIVEILRNPVFNEKEVRAFFASWYEWTYDTRSSKSFEHL
jgi:hypothetical protein